MKHCVLNGRLRDFIASLLIFLSPFTPAKAVVLLQVNGGVSEFGSTFFYSVTDEASGTQPLVSVDTGLQVNPNSGRSGSAYAIADFQSGVMASIVGVWGGGLINATGGATALDSLIFHLPTGMTSAEVTLTMDLATNNFGGAGRAKAETMLVFGGIQKFSLNGGSTSITLTVTDGQAIPLHASLIARATESEAASSRAQATLRLDTSAGVTYSAESGVSFASSLPDGGSPETPILPDPGSGGSILLERCGLWVVRCFIDPVVAVGYEYVLQDGLSGIESILLPENIGDGLYQLLLFDVLTGAYVDSGLQLIGGDVFSFVDELGLVDGVRRFQIRGIETEAMLDPTDFTRFVTGLTFVGNDLSGFLSMNPLTQEVSGTVPEPHTLYLTLLGLGATLASRRWMQRPG